MKTQHAALPFLALSLATILHGQTPQPPSTDLVPAEAKVELIQSGFKFTEGPATAADGKVYFTDIPNNRIHVYDPATGTVAVHRENTGAANGLMFTTGGALLACEGKNRQVTQQVGESITPVMSEYEGKKFNAPNDLDIDEKGGIYLTDPLYAPKGTVPELKEAVYYMAPPTGKVIKVIDTLQKPNGVVLSPDYKTLYVGDNTADSVHAFDVNPADGTVSNQRVFAPSAPTCDGLAVDERGNVYVTTKVGVSIYSPTGQDLGTIIVPEMPRNCCFGLKGTKTLYITALTGFYKLRMTVDGPR